MGEKIDVNGPSTHPVYKVLKQTGGEIKWNFFSKFLVSCDAKVCRIGRFDNAMPKDLVEFFVNRLPGSVEVTKPGLGVSFIFTMVIVGGAFWCCVNCEAKVKKGRRGIRDNGEDDDYNGQDQGQ